MNSKQQELKDLISIADLSEGAITDLITAALKLKDLRQKGREDKPLSGKTLAMIFQKPSTRTSVSFAAGMVQLGGFPLILNAQDMQMKRGETFADTAKILSRFVDAVMIRANRHEDVEELAKSASIPVINGLSDKEHPCQVLGDMMTLVEQKKLKDARGLKGLKLAYFGDGNNMTHSLILACATLGMDIACACPKGHEPEKDFVKQGMDLARVSGGKVTVTHDPAAAASGADALYTDVWVSMGKDENPEDRKQIFMPYQINAGLMAFAKPNVSIMHCLPAHRGEEISAEAMDGPRSVIFEQAENRLHIQKAILLSLLKG